MSVVNPSSDSPGGNYSKPPRRRRPWLRALAWTMSGIVGLTILAGVTVAILLHSERMHSYLLRKLESQATERLGIQVRLRNFALHLSSLSVDLYGLTVNGAEPYANPPLLQVQHAQAGVRIVSFFRRKWYIDSFQVDHPVIQIFVDAGGKSNLPVFKSSGSSSNNDEIFELGIRHALIGHGEVYYNNRLSSLDADLHDFELDAAFNNLLQQYSGHLTYSNGHLVYGGYRPITHDLAVEFAVTPSEIDLKQAKFSVGSSQVNLSGKINQYSSSAAAQGNYDITLDGTQIGQLLHQPSLPNGLVRTSGSIQYQNQPGRALLDSIALTGELASRRLDLKASSVRAAVDNVAGHYSLANGIVTLRDLRAGLLGGEMNASGEIGIAGQIPHSRLSVALRKISLEDVRPMLGKSTAKLNVALAGELNADASATWGKTINDLTAHADATISGQIARSPNHGPHAVQVANAPAGGSGSNQSVIPLQSAIHATYTNKSQELALADSYIRAPQTNLTLSGTLSNRSNLNFHLQANDLREVETIADLFRTSQSGQSQFLGLAGTATFQGTVHGSTSAPHLTGDLIASNLQLNGTSWKAVRANLDASPSSISIQRAELDPATRGRIAFDASAQLKKWTFDNTSNLQVNLQASQLDIAEVMKLAKQSVSVTGTLTAKVVLHGTELNPIGNGTLSIANGKAYGEPIQSFNVTFSGTGDEIHGEVSAHLPAGSLDSKVSVRPKEKSYTAHLTSSGIDLSRLDALKTRNIDAAGVVSINASGQGTFDNPQVNATVRIPKLTIHDQTIADINLQADLANHIANATLSSTAVNTSIQAKAKVSLTGDYPADASLDTQAIELQPLLAIYAPDEADKINGQTEVHATLRGPLKDKKRLETHLTIPTLKMAYGDTVQLAAALPIRVDYKDGVINVQRGAIRGTDTSLEFQGSIPTATAAPMSLMLVGTVDLKLAQLFDPDITSSGELKFNINSNGAANDPNVGGQVDIVDANFTSNSVPAGLSHGNGTLTLTRDRISVTKFEGTVGGGSLNAQGAVILRPDLRFDLGVAANGVRLLYPQGMRERVDANVRLTGTPDHAVLGGTVGLADLSFTPAFDLSGFAGQFSSGVSAPPSHGFSQNVQLNLAVHSNSDVNLVSRTLSIGGSANLQVRGTAADPVVLGRINLTSGDVILNGNRFVLNGGTVQFINPSETQPVVNLSVATNIQQYNITLRFQGPVDQLSTQYSSDPALPQADIVNLLAFGQTTEASAANSAATSTNQQAEALVASQVSSQVTSRVSRIAGISQLSISPVLPGSSTTGGANITIQQRVTGNLFITFSTNVATTQSQTIQGQYQVSPRVAVSATRDPNGGVAFDTLIKKTW